MMRSLLRFTFGMAFLGLAACATPGAGGESTPIYNLAEERVEPRVMAPRVYVLEKEGRSIAVFGTTHLVPDRMRWLSAATETMLRKADLVLTETSLSRLDEVLLSDKQKQALAPRMVLPPGRTLWTMAASEDAAQIRAALARQGLSPDRYAPLKPWVVCRDLQIPPGAPTQLSDEDHILIGEMTTRYGDPDRFPPDLKIEVFAVANGIETMFLESEYDRALNFSRLSDADALDCAANSAARVLAPGGGRRLVDDYGRMLNAWISGDIETARRWVADDQNAVNPAWSQLFLQARDAAWLKLIEAQCDKAGRDCFIAVGFSHLGGPDGLIAGLERMGWRLQRGEG